MTSLKLSIDASAMDNILDACTTKGVVFVMPSEQGVVFSNSKAEEDASAYVIVPATAFKVFEFDGEDDVAYCLKSYDLTPILSKISGDVVLEFGTDEEMEQDVLIFESADEKFSGKIVLQSADIMEEIYGFDELRSAMRNFKTLEFENSAIMVSEPMFEQGKIMFARFKHAYSPILIPADNVVLTCDKELFTESINADTNNYTFSEKIKPMIFFDSDSEIQASEFAEFEEKTTSIFLEEALKKHKAPVKWLAAIDTGEGGIGTIPFFGSNKTVNDDSFYTVWTVLVTTTNIEDY